VNSDALQKYIGDKYNEAKKTVAGAIEQVKKLMNEDSPTPIQKSENVVSKQIPGFNNNNI
jgi:hypothetical protein